LNVFHTAASRAAISGLLTRADIGHMRVGSEGPLPGALVCGAGLRQFGKLSKLVNKLSKLVNGAWLLSMETG
jgi:hypothetical protein